MSKSRVARIAVVALLAALVPVVVPQSSFAATACDAPAHKSWVGADGSGWGDPANWNPAGVPGPTDDVCIADGIVNVDVPATASTLDAGGAVIVSSGASLALSGTGESEVVALTVEGSFDVSGPFTATGALHLSGGALSGIGTVRVSDGAEATVTGTTPGIDVVTVNSGSFQVDSAELKLTKPFTNEGTVTLDAVISTDGSTPQKLLMTGAGAIVNNGTFVTGGYSVLIDGAFSNVAGAQVEAGTGGFTATGFASTQGAVTVAGGVFAVPSFTVSAGASLELLNSTSVASIGNGDGTLTVEPAGILRGAGFVNGTVDNFGEVSIVLGASAGSLTVTKDFVARPDSLLLLPLHGPTMNTEFARLAVLQTVTAGGTVEVPTDGFVPTVGANFRIVESAATTGAFASVNSDLTGAVVLSSQTDAAGLLVTAAGNTGSISGSIYNDRNGNGQRNTDDAGLVGRSVYVDSDGDHIQDDEELATVTDAEGNYVLEGIVTGAVSIETVVPADWVVTSAPVSAVVTAGVTEVSKDFGQFQKSDIAGVAYIDSDGNGAKSPSEAVASGRTIYLDANNNGVRNVDELSTVTDASGGYRFSDVGPGSYRSRIVLTGGYVLSASLVTLVAQSGVDSTATFGLYLFSTVRGTVYRDLDRDGVRDGGEPALSGRGLFVDKNKNGVFDGTDVSETTASNGTYAFSALIGTQNIRLVLSPGEFQTPVVPMTVPLRSGNVSNGVSIGVATPAVDVLPSVIDRTDPMSDGTGYWLAAADGGLFTYGSAQFFGSMGGSSLNSPIVGFDPLPNGTGYHLVAGDGGVFSFGNARFHGSMGGSSLNSPMVGIASTATGDGYWTVAGDGGVFSYGDAEFYGSMGGERLNSPVVDLVPTATGNGYWQVAADGGIFSYGDAQFHGSAEPHRGSHVIIGMARAGANGYWIADADGGVYAYGDAQFHGSMGGTPLSSPIVSIRSTDDGSGYWLFAEDGGVFSFGSAKYYGGTPKLNSPIVE